MNPIDTDDLFTDTMQKMVEAGMQGAKGIEDCKAGISPQSDDKHYLDGYSHQYEIEAKEGANNDR